MNATSPHFFKIVANHSFLECEVVSICEQTHDYLVKVKVSSSKLTGEHDFWATHKDLECFYKDLERIYLDFKGEAVLKSMSPDECHIKIAPLNSRGHFGVSGVIKFLNNISNVS